MRYAIFVSLLAVSLTANAANRSLDLPSCDIKSQREVAGQTVGKISDPRQAHISVRAKVLSADINSALKAQKITQVEAQRMTMRVKDILEQTDRFVEQQGFLSAAEIASYDRELDAIAIQLCRKEKTNT